jgi:hypothetical protein
MHIRSKAYLHMLSRLRDARGRLAPREDAASREASPLLIYIAVVLVLLLAMLEIDRHSAELRSMGLMGDTRIDPIFMSP